MNDFRFNIPLLANRLISTTDWIKNKIQTRDLKMGYFGASTGAAAALVVAANRPILVHALVSREGRPDLAGSELERVRDSTMFIVGQSDETAVDLNRKTFKNLGQVKNKKIEIVSRATHLFEEPGALDEVAKFATDWFSIYLK